MDGRIEKLCRGYTDLDYEDIREIYSAAKTLGNMANLFEADAFIDCLINDGSGDSIVVAEAKPSGSPSSYKKSVVGMVATKEKEPAVARSFALGVTTKYMKALTQENVNVVQNVDPIYSKDRIIGVFIIEQRTKKIDLPYQKNGYNGLNDHTIDMDSKMDLDKVDDKENYRIVDTFEEGVLFVNYENIVVFSNKAAQQIYESLGFINAITNRNYSDINLIDEKPMDSVENSNVKEVKAGKYYFNIKRITVNKPEIKFIVTISDITDRKIQEQALVLKSVALKEIHHRIKNNLQTIASLLRLQRNHIESEDGKKALENTVNRILAISYTHEIMLNTGIDSVGLNDIIYKIRENTIDYYLNDDFDLEVECHGGDFDIDVNKAMAVALILNELMQNSIKYAFKGRKSGKILILAKKKSNDEMLIVFRDYGIGFDVNKLLKGESMGWTIIKLMVEKKLKGHLSVVSDSTGTKVEMLF